ncbi:amino acid transporter [Trypanosoma rangeli SC58]|uniref:Amino acid transporter n=1 Tax=Trypanosoma rangeli SC58 TaxID=429131 RepID=A0A061IS10_TRYRA|nr:amino acid transporter [Trypanosoma rangeli SC58]
MTHEARIAPPEAVGGPHAPANREDTAQPLLDRAAGEATPSIQTSRPPLPPEAVQEGEAEQVVGEACVKEDAERRGWGRSVMASLSSIIPPGGMLSTVFNIASICVGAGILGLPAASNSSGVVMALVYPAIVGALTVYALYCLAAQMERLGLATYEGMARTLLGPGLDYFTAALRTANTFGGCVAFIICVADIFRAIFKNADASGYWRSSSGTRLLTSLVWLVLMLPFVIPRRINSLRYVSTVGIVFIIYFVVMIIVHSGMNGLAENSKHITVAGRPTDDGVHMFGTGNKALDGIGVFMFSYTCHIGAFEVYWDMRERSVSRFTLYSAIAILLCCILYALTGIFGYFDFGSRATVSALLLYDPVKEPAMMVAYVGVLVKLCASYPTCHHDHPQLPLPQFWVEPRHAAVLETLHLRHQPRCCFAALRPVHPKDQHGVWPHWCVLWRYFRIYSSRSSDDVRRQLVAAVGWMDALHPHVRAASRRCCDDGVRHGRHHLQRCEGRLSAACGQARLPTDRHMFSISYALRCSVPHTYSLFLCLCFFCMFCVVLRPFISSALLGTRACVMARIGNAVGTRARRRVCWAALRVGGQPSCPATATGREAAGAAAQRAVDPSPSLWGCRCGCHWARRRIAGSARTSGGHT